MPKSGINDATTPAEHLLCDAIDTLHRGMQALRTSLPKEVRRHMHVFYLHASSCFANTRARSAYFQGGYRCSFQAHPDHAKCASHVCVLPPPPPLCFLCLSGHRQFAGVAYKLADEVWMSQYNSMPFGAVASVHAWDRVGAFVRTLGRKLFHLVLFRYVDDFFAPKKSPKMPRTFLHDSCVRAWGTARSPSAS